MTQNLELFLISNGPVWAVSGWAVFPDLPNQGHFLAENNYVMQLLEHVHSQ